MTALQPRPPHTSEELTKLYPETLELHQVQILLRHGERSPVKTRFENAGLPRHWPYCGAANALRSTVLTADGSWDTLTWQRKLESLGKDDAPTPNTGSEGETNSICQPGELTDRGRETTLALGQRIRNLYVDQLGFLPGLLDRSSASSIRLRSTPVPRALESVQQSFIGLYPAHTRQPGTPPPVVATRNFSEESLFPNEGACKRFGELARAFANRTAELYNSGPELEYINKKIGKWMPPESPVIKVDSAPRLIGVMDSINGSLAHGSGTRLPNEFYDPKVLESIDRICTEEWFIGYQESDAYRRLGIGPLIGDLAQKMVEHTREGGVAPAKMTLAGCHDTTIAASLTALGVFDVKKDKWPGFTSSIAFELFRRKDMSTAVTDTSSSGAIWPSKEKTWWYSLFSTRTPAIPPARSPIDEWSESEKKKLDNYYVRLRYNDKPVSVPFCKAAGRHLDGDESFCTLAAFKQAADSFTPRDWKAECVANLGKPAMSGCIERPLGV